MELAPLTMQDPWAHRVLHDSSANVQTLSAVPTEVGVSMEQVDLLHHTEEENFRPYLHLRGRVEELIPDVDMPYGISRMAFKEGSGPRFDGFYEFTDAQLSEMVSKGYFSADFEVPSQMEGITWDFPGEVDYQVVFPETYDQVPVVFVEMADRNDMLLTEASTEYDLHNYFPDYSRSEEQLNQQVEAEQITHQQQAEQYRGQMRDLFADEQFEEPAVQNTAQMFTADESISEALTGRGLPQTVFEQLVARSEQHQEQLEEQLRDAAAEDPESAASLYRDVVAPGARSGFSAQAEQQLREMLEDVAESADELESDAGHQQQTDAEPETEADSQEQTRKNLRAARQRRQQEVSAADDIFAGEFEDDEPEGPSL